ncbi:MAG: GNAT family N-acetyltransferase [Armatimonadota bacterium]
MSDQPYVQLVMLHPSLAALPPVILPDGYGLRTFQPGDDAHWSRIIAESFRRLREECSFDTMMRNDPAFHPERIFFITHGKEPVATASAWYVPEKLPDAGMIHYVGACDKHTGKKLGYWVSLAALHHMVQERRRRAWLSTDDTRLPAIKTYLNLGFAPLLIHEEQRERWAAVFRALGLPELVERFSGILAGEVTSW